MASISAINPKKNWAQLHAAALRKQAEEIEAMDPDMIPDMLVTVWVHNRSGSVITDVSDPVYQGGNMLLIRGALQTALMDSFLEPIEETLGDD